MNARTHYPLVDPICGMAVDAPTEALSCEYLGQTYAFCCAQCQALFLRAPARIIVELAHTGLNHADYPCQQHERVTEPWYPDSRVRLQFSPREARGYPAE